MLKLYAYYKQALAGDNFSYDGKVDVRDAFKFNAWTQLNGMTQEDAKKQYIKLVKNILKEKGFKFLYLCHQLMFMLLDML